MKTSGRDFRDELVLIETKKKKKNELAKESLNRNLQFKSTSYTQFHFRKLIGA